MASRKRISYDPVAAFLGEQFSEEQLKLLQTSSQALLAVPRSLDGLEQLARRFAWAAVLELSTSLLADDDDLIEAASSSTTSIPAHEAQVSPTPLLPHQRLTCAAYRSLALLQTRQVERAADTIHQLGDLSEANEKYRYESFPNLYPPTQFPPGSFVPFELKILAIEIRMEQDPSVIDACYELKCLCAQSQKQAMHEKERMLWHAREAQLLSSLAVHHLRARQHDAAVDVALQLVTQQGATAIALYMYARVLIYAGDFDGAKKVLDDAIEKPDSTPQMHTVHYAQYLAALGNFQDALEEYEVAIQICENESAQFDVMSDTIWVFAMNNSAICLLHLGKLEQAIQRLESCLRKKPVCAMDEGVVLNTATLYDLAFPDRASDMKSVLQALASKYGRQGFNLEVVNTS